MFNKNLGNWSEFLLIFSGIGVYIGLTNLIPLKLSGISNDGNNIMSIEKSNEAKYSFFIQLKVNSLLMKGTRIKDMLSKVSIILVKEDYFMPMNF